MGFLKKLWRRRREVDKRRSFTDATHWHIQGVEGFERFFSALPDHVPPDSVVGLAGGFQPSEVKRYLTTNAVICDDGVIEALPPEFHNARYLLAEKTSMAALSVFSQHCAEPEIAIHVVVVSCGSSIIEWYDAPSGRICLKGSFDEAIIRDLAKVLGGIHERAEVGA